MAAGETLTRRHYRSVLRFFELKCPAEADELTQATFEACVSGRDRFRAEASFRGYLFGIARIKLLEQIRRSRGRAGPQRFGAEDGEATGISTLLARRQQHQLVLQAMAALPAAQLVALQLYYWEELPTADIAAALDVPQSTVTSRLARAREALRTSVVALSRPGGLRDSATASMERWARELAEDE